MDGIRAAKALAGSHATAVPSVRHHERVTKLDERAQVPGVGPQARERLAVALDLDGVVAASLIGSQASGKAGPLSDVDIAVWLEPGISPQRRSSLRLQLADAAGRALATDEVDVVILNEATPLICHRAMRDGVGLMVRNQVQRVRLETGALLTYFDTAPLRREFDRARSRRLEEGRFGRR